MKRGNSKGMLNVCNLTYHYVYQTKNLINGKTYIGRHSTNNLNDGYMGSGKMLKRAIQKHGKENFECIPLCHFDTHTDSNSVGCSIVGVAKMVNAQWYG